MPHALRQQDLEVSIHNSRSAMQPSDHMWKNIRRIYVDTSSKSFAK